jgi:hypothetical protein
MVNNKITKALLGASAAVVLLGAFSANAQTAPPAGSVSQRATNNANPGVVPPQTGEANDHTSANAEMRPEGKARPLKHKAKKAKAKAPVTGEANDHSSNGGSTEAGKAAKDAKDAKTPGM